ncbi:hypothetical protein M446_6207 [Methylobacterium sp. 4-46]|uniref:hypothetical protein n=1 Tax=unclassified Methylobacterium TaxID=2615210 RepID=UPI000152E240|nr:MULTISPECIES: hypothetical protein [Methylobacterium]ACA20475.1 hypothetical protein M446_6207 [Methylobacterium sp. 4-46]WFT79643.1 hypothetical protein QA634_31355 [Methylobacterium nodulans]
MKLKPFLAAGALLVAAAPAFAQGGSPYNASGSQAGGPRAGIERRYGLTEGDRAGYDAIYPRERAPFAVVPRGQAYPGFLVEE